MSFIDAIKTCFTKYACFSGRASRSEYWLFWLFQILVNSVLLTCEYFADPSGDNPSIFYFLYLIWGIAVLVPSISVFVRRMHDIGKSGWNYFLWLIPFVGYIIQIVFLCTKSDPVDNQYGPVPSVGNSNSGNF